MYHWSWSGVCLKWILNLVEVDRSYFNPFDFFFKFWDQITELSNKHNYSKPRKSLTLDANLGHQFSTLVSENFPKLRSVCGSKFRTSNFPTPSGGWLRKSRTFTFGEKPCRSLDLKIARSARLGRCKSNCSACDQDLQRETCDGDDRGICGANDFGRGTVN